MRKLYNLLRILLILLCNIERELLIILGPGFISMSPASKSNKISTILKNKLQIKSFKANDIS